MLGKITATWLYQQFIIYLEKGKQFQEKRNNIRLSHVHSTRDAVNGVKRG